MDDAILAREVPENILPGLEAKEGETAGAFKREILEDGSSVYSRTFSGKTVDGKDYSYVATYDPASPKPLTYEVQSGVTPEAASSGMPQEVVTSETRPTFNIPESKDNQQAASNAYNDYINSQILASTTRTPESIAAANQSKLNYELAQKSVNAPTGLEPELLPTGVDSGYTGVVPASELGSQAFPLTPPVDNTPITASYGRILGGLTASGLLTAPQAVAKQPTTGALGTATTTYKTPAPYVEQPSFTLNPVEPAKAPQLLFGPQLARGGLAHTRYK